MHNFLTFFRVWWRKFGIFCHVLNQKLMSCTCVPYDLKPSISVRVSSSLIQNRASLMGKFAMSNVFNRYERNRSQRVDVTSPIASKEQFLSTREREERMISRTRFSMLSTVLKFYYDLSNNLYENGIREETVNESQEANLFYFILMNTL